jgi:N-acetyl-anhydromuramyl-L-alanine amidase AmpD
VEPPVSIPSAFHFTEGDNLTPTRVVIHATNPDGGTFPAMSAGGMAASTERYFADADALGSAHYVADSSGDVHPLADAVIAWHAPPNAHSIGVEICAMGGDVEGDYTRAQWLSAEVWPAVNRAAEITAAVCARYGIPAVRISAAELAAGAHGVCGHVDVAQAFGKTDHTDPGPNFPWTEFMAAVGGRAANVTAPLAAMPAQLSEGDEGPLVHELQVFLDRNYPAYARIDLGPQRFGPQTLAAVLEFQHRSHLDADGVVGPQTWSALMAAGFRP